MFLHQNTEKQMRQLAVIPPMLFDAEQQRIKFINMNGLMGDPMKVYKDRQVMNMWSEQEKDTFREKWVECLRLQTLFMQRFFVTAFLCKKRKDTVYSLWNLCNR